MFWRQTQLDRADVEWLTRLTPSGLDDWRPRLPPNYLYYAGRRNPPPALRVFIDAMKASLPL